MSSESFNYPPFNEDELINKPPEEHFVPLDLKIGAIYTKREVEDLVGRSVRILMDSGINTAINVTRDENAHTDQNNHEGITYIPEAHLNMKALAGTFRLDGHSVLISPSQIGSFDGIFSTDSDKTFIIFERLSDDAYRVEKIFTVISNFTHKARSEKEPEWKKRLIEAAKAAGSNGEIGREIAVMENPFEFGDLRLYMQGTAAHPGPFGIAGIADTAVRIVGEFDGIDPEKKYNLLKIDGEDVFVIGVKGNVLTLLLDPETGEQAEVDISGKDLTLNDGLEIKNFSGGLAASVIGRSTWKGHREFEQLLQKHVDPSVKIYTALLRQPFYHKDTTGFKLNRHFFTNGAAFTEQTFEMIHELFGAGNVKELSLEDICQAFGGNAHPIGNSIYISDEISYEAIYFITALGYDVHLDDISYTKKSGGGESCMSSQQYVYAPGVDIAPPPADEFDNPIKGRVFKSIINYQNGEIYYGLVRDNIIYKKGTDLGVDDLIFPDGAPKYLRSAENGLVRLDLLVGEHRAEFYEAMHRMERAKNPDKVVPFEKRTKYLTAKRSETTNIAEFVTGWIELGLLLETFLDAAQSILLLGQETYFEHGHTETVPRVEMADIPVNGDTPQWVIDRIGDWRSSASVHKKDGVTINKSYDPKPTSVKDLVGIADIADAFHIPLKNTLGGAFAKLGRGIIWPDDIKDLYLRYYRLQKDYEAKVGAAIKTAVEAAVKTAINYAGEEAEKHPKKMKAVIVAATRTATETAMDAAIGDWDAKNGKLLEHTLIHLRNGLLNKNLIVESVIDKETNPRRFLIPNSQPMNPNIKDSLPLLAILGIAGTSHAAFDRAKVPRQAYYFLSAAAGGESNLTDSAMGLFKLIPGFAEEVTIGAKGIADMQKAVDLRHRTINIMRRMLEISGTTYSQAIGDLERIESFTKKERKPTFPLQDEQEAALLLYAVSAGIRQFEIAAGKRQAGEIEKANPLVAKLEKAADNLAISKNLYNYVLPEVLVEAKEFITQNMQKAEEIDASNPSDKAGPMLSRKASFELSLSVLSNIRSLMVDNMRSNYRRGGAAQTSLSVG